MESVFNFVVFQMRYFHFLLSALESFGNKVKTGAQIAGAMKTIWDVGKGVAAGVRYIAAIFL